MTKPFRTTRRSSVTVADETTNETLGAALDSLPGGGRPYILESHSFSGALEQRKREEVRAIDDLEADIGRLQAELDARRDHLAERQQIVWQIDAALAVGPRSTRAPLLSQRPVEEEQ